LKKNAERRRVRPRLSNRVSSRQSKWSANGMFCRSA
jgi:hypothetical protein